MFSLAGVPGFQIRESGERFVGRDIDAAFGLGDPPCLDRASAALLSSQHAQATARYQRANDIFRSQVHTRVHKEVASQRPVVGPTERRADTCGSAPGSSAVLCRIERGRSIAECLVSEQEYTI